MSSYRTHSAREAWARIKAVFDRAHADVRLRFVPSGNEVAFSRRWLDYDEWAEIILIAHENKLMFRSLLALEGQRLLDARARGLNAREAWWEKRRRLAVEALRARAKRRDEEARKLLGYAEQTIASGLPTPPRRERQRSA